MKPDIHPAYRTVVFHDTSANEYFKVGSTIKTDREIELDGENVSVYHHRGLFKIAPVLHRQAENVLDGWQCGALP